VHGSHLAGGELELIRFSAWAGISADDGALSWLQADISEAGNDNLGWDCYLKAGHSPQEGSLPGGLRKDG
jgi:hypothetical protein